VRRATKLKLTAKSGNRAMAYKLAFDICKHFAETGGTKIRVEGASSPKSKFACYAVSCLEAPMHYW
jgi:hypothetical protein